jgi:Putative prokaryotic signal transducing protein
MDDHLVRVFASGDSVAGEMMRGRLEAEGITAMLKGEGEGPYRAGPVYVWVAAEDEAAARAIVAAVESGAFALDEDAGVDDVPEEPAGDAAR